MLRGSTLSKIRSASPGRLSRATVPLNGARAVRMKRQSVPPGHDIGGQTPTHVRAGGTHVMTGDGIGHVITHAVVDTEAKISVPSTVLRGGSVTPQHAATTMSAPATSSIRRRIVRSICSRATTPSIGRPSNSRSRLRFQSSRSHCASRAWKTFCLPGCDRTDRAESRGRSSGATSVNALR